MNKNCSIDVIDGITRIHCFKNPGIKDIRRSIDDAAGMDRSGLRLWDLSCSAINLNSAQLQELAEYGKIKFLPPSKVAIVAPVDFTFGICEDVRGLQGTGANRNNGLSH